MKPTEKLAEIFRAPRLTRLRIVLALAVAVVVDVLELTQIPVFEQVLDVVAMALTTWLIGFHLLLLPTFAVEFIPVVDMLPTWTGCVAAVIALRKREQRAAPKITTSPPKPDPQSPSLN